MERGLRPSSSETCFPKPTNLAFGEDQASSGILFVLTLRIIDIRDASPLYPLPRLAQETCVL